MRLIRRKRPPARGAYRCTLAALIASVGVIGSLSAVAAAPVPPWTTNGPAGEDILSLAVDPVRPATIYAGAELGRIFKSIDGGMSWNLLDTGLLTGIHTFFITADGMTIYVGTDNGIFVSTNAGEGWNRSGLDATVVNALIADPNAPQTLYAGAGGGGGNQGVFRGSVGSTEWTPINAGLPDTITAVSALAIDPPAAAHITPSTLLAATDAGLFRLPDLRGQGATWVSINSGLPDAAINVITTDPHDLFTVYAGTDVGVFVSADVGDTWDPIDPSFTSSVSSLVIDPSIGTLYAGTFGDGVFVSAGGAAHFNDFNDGLANGVVHALAIDTGAPAKLFAGTIGDGVFVAPAAQCVGDCDGGGEVTVDEIITMVNIDLGNAAVISCPAADPDNTGTVAITQIIMAVNNALNGCSPAG